jgi:glycosyltransferase involved in cell wall biosynthesis
VKLLFFNIQNYYGGAERAMTNIMNMFSEHAHEVVFVNGCVDKRDYALHPNIRVIDLRIYYNFKASGSSRFNRLYTQIRYVLPLRKVLRRERPDALIAFPDIVARMALAANLGLRIPYINRVCADLDTIGISPLLRKILIWITALSDGCVFQNPTANMIYPQSLRQRSVFIPNVVDKRFFDTVRSERRADIIGVGRLVSFKNWQLAIRAFAKIAGEINDNLYLYGEGGEKDNLRRLIDSIGLGNRVFLCGNVPDIEKKLSAARLFVMPSNTEALPNVVLEAQAMGLPCVSTRFDGGAAEWVIQDGTSGILVPKNDVNAMAAAMLRVLSDDGLTQSLSEGAKAASQRVHPDTLFAQWEGYVSAVTARK